MTTTSNLPKQPNKGGFVMIHRDVFESDIFANEPFTEREAWIWLIAAAAWKQTPIRVCGTIVTLERGQLTFSLRFLAESWNWKSDHRVRSFLDRLKASGMIETKTGAVGARSQTKLTICNYDTYQQSGRTQILEPAHSGRKEEELNNRIKERIEDIPPVAVTEYVFNKGVVRLTAASLKEWEEAYPDINIRAELQSAYEWAATKPNWYMALNGLLSKRNREAIDRQKAKQLELAAGHKPVVTGGGWA